jgi:hypothetical protein
MMMSPSCAWRRQRRIPCKSNHLLHGSHTVTAAYQGHRRRLHFQVLTVSALLLSMAACVAGCSSKSLSSPTSVLPGVAVSGTSLREISTAGTVIAYATAPPLANMTLVAGAARGALVSWRGARVWTVANGQLVAELPGTLSGTERNMLIDSLGSAVTAAALPSHSPETSVGGIHSTGVSQLRPLSTAGSQADAPGSVAGPIVQRWPRDASSAAGSGRGLGSGWGRGR